MKHAVQTAARRTNVVATILLAFLSLISLGTPQAAHAFLPALSPNRVA